MQNHQPLREKERLKLSGPGGAEECIFDGNSNYKVNYKGSVVYSENGSAKIQLKRIGDSDQGGYFKFICGTITQDVPANLFVPGS